ncbi:siphovirus ReqiPepy6 Gp37-like family protein [Cytobacillus horneckiae]|uniref:siphovirus ReqiPepy6 Gp37-like family protein n=1 Tax=Cytobacillus horneckiae TaxID=549687 RepID=UPI003D9A8667
MLYVCNENFERLGMVGRFSYLLWRKKYSSHGEAELHVDVTTENINLLQKGRILFRKDDNEAMFIYYRGFSEDATGKDQLVIKCFSLIRWLDRRILWRIATYNNTPEDIVRSMISTEIISPSNLNRRISQIKLAARKGFGSPIELQASYVDLLEKIEAICNTYEMGIRTIFDGIEAKFDLYEGVNRTVNQSTYPRVILSKDFSNVLSRKYEEADNDVKNTALIGGEGEGTARTLTSIEQGTGLNRKETFVDARDISNQTEDNVQIPDAEYKKILKQRGLEKLLDFEDFYSLECELDVTKENTKYGRDFFLGDLITIRDDKLGIIMNSRVEEVDEVYQQSKEIYVRVGKSVPTLTEKMKKLVNR